MDKQRRDEVIGSNEDKTLNEHLEQIDKRIPKLKDYLCSINWEVEIQAENEQEAQQKAWEIWESSDVNIEVDED